MPIPSNCLLPGMSTTLANCTSHMDETYYNDFIKGHGHWEDRKLTTSMSVIHTINVPPFSSQEIEVQPAACASLVKSHHCNNGIVIQLTRFAVQSKCNSEIPLIGEIHSIFSPIILLKSLRVQWSLNWFIWVHKTMNLGLDYRSSSSQLLNLWLNFGQVCMGSGSDLSSGPDGGSTTSI